MCAFGGVDPARLVRLRIDRDALPTIDLAAYAAVLMGGGPANFASAEDAKSPQQRRYEAWLIALMRQIIATDTPFFGMCLGIGIVTKARGEAPSFDYHEPVKPTRITLTEAGRDDPLLVGLPSEFFAIVGHKEGVGVAPRGSVELAHSAACVQMLRVGRNVYATQFHPELEATGLRVRLEAYRHHGYCRPDEVEELVALAARADLRYAPVALRRFVETYITVR